MAKKKKNNSNDRQLNDPNGTIRQLKPISHRRRDGLIQYSYDKTSQSGEDGIIDYLFKKIPLSSSSNGLRWAVDIGAWDGVHLSNTHSLLVADMCDYGDGQKGDIDNKSSDSINARNIDQNGNGDGNEIKNNDDESSSISSSRWKGILIEADETKFQQLESLHAPLGNICHNIAVSCQPWSKQSLANILSSTSTKSLLPLDFDFLCIDVDGTDYWLLHNLLTETSFRPKVICIEFNPTIPHSILFIPPRDDTMRQGCSITALFQLASSFKYQLVETTCYNAFFVLESLFESTSIKNDIPFEPRIENLHEITMGTSLYQLYDGTIKLAGCQKMLWHRKPIREEDVQILKKEERSFPFAPGTVNGTTDSHVYSTSMGMNSHDNITGENENETINHDKQHMMYHHLAIDMSSYCSPSASTTIDQKAKCSSQIYQHLEQDGFALVRGTGISSTHCQNALSCTKSFFQHANEKVRRSCLTKDRARRGYSPQNSENFASLLGLKGSNDLVRKFRVGPCHMISGDNVGGKRSSDCSDMDTESSTVKNESFVPSSLHQPNAWPTKETWGEQNATKFQSHIETYYTEICQVANNIVNAICDGITKHNPKIVLPSSLIGVGTETKKKDEEGNEHLEEQQQQCTIENTSILTLLGYKKGARHQGRHSNPLIAAHTDVGVITVLLFDGGDCATLQRSQSSDTDNDENDCENVNSHHSWVDVKLPTTIPQDPIFVVNIGDCLSDMCDNALPSTLHRVMPCKGGTLDRNCLALFMGLNHDEVLNLPSGECMTYEEWRRRRIACAQDVLLKHKEKKG